MHLESDVPERFDLLVAAGRVVDSVHGTNGPGFVGVRNGRIAAMGSTKGHSEPKWPAANKQIECPQGILLPGLVDMHAHPGVEGSKHGIDPDVHMLLRGTTTVLSQGDAGARNWPRYRMQMIEAARTRVRLAINLAVSGESRPGPSFGDIAEADVGACVEAIRDGGPAIWGIAVNVSESTCGDSNPREVMQLAIEAAEQTDRPLLVGTRHADDWPIDDLLDQLRPGDVVTYCFHGFSDRIVRDGRVLDCVRKARERGVLFDTGHGMRSFDFEVAEACVRSSFLPDTISTDQYRRHLGSDPCHDLPLTFSKLLAAGMSEDDVWPRVTSRPAELLGLSSEIGTLQPGACADLVVLAQTDSELRLQDSNGNERNGRLWYAAAVVRGGEIVVAPAT